MSNVLGWVPFDERTAEQNRTHDAIVKAMPDFVVNYAAGKSLADAPKKVMLTDTWKHPRLVDALGFAFPGVLQITGSCVGAGGGNVLMTLSALEVIRLGDREKITMPFWLYPYGKSRQRAGMRGRGEGSFGSTFADACKLDGSPDAHLEGMPKYQRTEEYVTWGRDLELAWSDGAAAPQEVSQEGKKHLVQTVAPLRSKEAVRESILNFYPATKAYDYYVGKARVVGSKDPVAVGKFDGRGGHQTSILGFWDHDELGWLFLYMNQWPRSGYPVDPGGCPRGGCWISGDDMDKVCRNGEVYGFSQYQGYPSQEVNYIF